MKVKKAKILNWYFENGMIFLFSILTIIYFINQAISIYKVGHNRTIGWKWILTSTDFILTYYTLVFYFFGFLVLFILKRKTNLLLSKLFVIILVLIFIYDSIYANNRGIILYTKLINFLLFLYLFFSSLLKKRSNSRAYEF